MRLILENIAKFRIYSEKRFCNFAFNTGLMYLKMWKVEQCYRPRMSEYNKRLYRETRCEAQSRMGDMIPEEEMLTNRCPVNVIELLSCYILYNFLIFKCMSLTENSQDSVFKIWNKNLVQLPVSCRICSPFQALYLWILPKIQ